MKLYINPDQIPDSSQFEAWKQMLRDLKQSLMVIKVSLSMEERQRSRKMGPRRLAYAQASERRGVQHEDVMPRRFTAYHFTRVITFHSEINALIELILELEEMMDDTVMAAGIDAMTYTKLVHDGLRSANLVDPSLDNALAQLDEFNRKAQAEEEEAEAGTPEGGGE